MHAENDHKSAWRTAVAWYHEQPPCAHKEELGAVIRPIYESLRQAPDVEALESMYLDPADIQSGLHGDESQLLDLSRTRDVAYGLRLRDLEAGRA